MAFTVQIHIINADPLMAEMDELPDPKASFIVCTNPRGRDGKSLHYIDQQAVRYLFPWHRISFIEVYPSEEERARIETFFRE